MSGLFNSALKGMTIDKRSYYSAKLHLHSETKDKSLELIKSQRVLKSKLEKVGFEFIISGNVRLSLVDNGANQDNRKLIFNEKGVDVRMAVDLVVAACDRTAGTVVLCSSDSDMQPAIKEARARGLSIVYLGFENAPNKGLTFTTNRTILFRNNEVLDSYKKPTTLINP